MRCPEDLELQSLLDEELNPWRAGAIQRHLEACPNCQRKLTELQEVVSLLQRTIKTETLPNYGRTGFRPGLPRFTAAAAVLLVMFSLASFWYLNYQRQSQISPEAELLLQQYLTLYKEDSELI